MNDIFDILGYDAFENYTKPKKESAYSNKSLVFAVIDSIFSINAHYDSVVEPLVIRFAKKLGLKVTDEYTVSQFVAQFNDYTGDMLANDVFENRQLTSTKSGILKAEAVRKVIYILFNAKIETKADLLQYENLAAIEEDIKKIAGQKSGLTFHYLMMHAGDLNRFKADRHIKDFFENDLGYKKLSDNQLEVAFKEQLTIVNKKYPDFTLRALDEIIWKKKSEDSAQAKKRCSKKFE